MLFNSYGFLFVFLPLALSGFYLLGRASRGAALGWLALVSLVFYAWWRPFNLVIIAPSIMVNFGLARLLQRMGAADRARQARAVLTLGILFNIGFLGYFKYANFAVSAMNDAFGTAFVLQTILLPLGISFITFQKIAFLVDVHAGRIESFSFGDYILFVLFFPQLIAGPIVHYREMMPQFQRARCRFNGEDFAVGLTLLALGLFKKVALADRIAPGVSAIYGQAAAGIMVPLVPAWLAAVGFTLQLYFDFSGYSDMALGLGRLFGVRFPANFYSPLKASSVIDFWQRWHMTLTRFLTAYLYNPLALWLARRRASHGVPGLVGGRTSLGAFAELVVFPTLVTMLVSGVWHGAGYLFILWGFVHGLYLVINHLWRQFVVRRFSDRDRYARVMAPVGFLITFIGVAAAMLLFRSSTLPQAALLLKGIVGLNGLFPVTIPLPGIPSMRGLLMWVTIMTGIALLLPNTLEVLSRFDPSHGPKPFAARTPSLPESLLWRPSLGWAIGIAAVAVAGVLAAGGPSEFLYWQF